MNKRYIPLLLIMLFLGLISGNAFGQRQRQQVKSVTIESVVKDDSGNPVPNAVIRGKEGAIEVTSDAEGKFTIEVPENSDLLIEAKGFEKVVLPTSLAASQITLVKAPFLMDEASTINIPFTKIKKAEVASAISVINPRDIIKYDNTQSIYSFISGRIPGMIGSSNIRGIGNAVFIIDGVPRDPSFLNMEEVEQITVLKDVNTSMLYGTQANNGLVLITTKRGQAHKRVLNFTFEQGISKPITLPKYLNTVDYMTLYNEALVNDGLAKTYPDDLIAKYASEYAESGKNPYRYPDNDYYSSQYLRDYKPFTKILTEFSGGSEVTQYYANLSWVHTESLYAIADKAKGNYNRFNIRANVNLKINDFINGYIDAVGIFSILDNPRGDFWSIASTELPNAYVNLLPVNLIKSNATMSGGADMTVAKRINGKYILGGSTQFQNNVYGIMNLAGYDQSLGRTATFNNGVDFDLRNIIEGLKFKTYLSFDIYNTYHQIVSNTYAVYAPVWTSYPDGTDSITKLTMVNKDLSTGVQTLPATGMSYTRRIGAYALLDYDRTFSDVHKLTGTLVAYHDRLRISDLFADEKHSHLALRLGYNYSNKYFVDFSSAYVNGFKLPKGNKGAFSPSVGLAWVISEDLMSGSSVVNYLKLKASAGIMNTEWVGDDYKLYERTYLGSSSFSWNDGGRSNTSTISTRAANPDLTFEKMKHISIGFEGYFFDKLLYADANLFSTRNTGELVQRTDYYPAYLYTNIPYENYEKTGYSGGELGLLLSKSMGDFSFELGANMLLATSKALVRSELWANDYQYREGKPADAIFGLEAIGFYRNTAMIDSLPKQVFGEVKPGDIIYKDQNKDGKIDSDDAIEIGNSTPRFTYGINFQIRYKNFTLFALGNGRTGSDAYYSGNYFRVAGAMKYSEVVLNRWTPATAETATYPRLSTKSSTNNLQNSTFWLYKNNYFTMDRMQLSYDIPGNLARKLYAKGLTVYLRGDWVFEIMKDRDKRLVQVGYEPSILRNYALGLKLMF